ncbi:MAG: biopolymer transporter ExbD [Fuerstiella sp.]|nr:biopolymer transporter ExbD [Fuerstiella sp.]MCP4509571.1 biopolymer transporter ExbD [Fuerstiella sp.]MDG2130812.1 biopolymer transporter ExbD [Fuerstiella sp.]
MKFELRKTGGKRRVDMTPMIDCVFQLLLFFLVASNFQEQARVSGEGELGANLPSVTSAMPMVMKPREMIVNVDSTGEFYLDGELHTEEALATRLQRAQTDNPGNNSVVIRGSQGADWKFVARVMSLCNQSEIQDYRVAVIPEDG